MFTGLIEALGAVTAVHPDGAGRLLEIREPGIAADLSVGASVAVNGVCLTVVACAGDCFRFQTGPETLRLTNLGELEPGMRVNLERSLRVSDRLGGHIVQGHVDGIARLEKREAQGEWEMLWFSCPKELTRQMAPKGSVAVDGVSLTLVDVTDTGFSVALIPHTLAATTLGSKKPTATVNLETDVLAKYVGRYLNTAGFGVR
ncbi:MAG: riboflavin synthase [Planctomycetes bacterium]|nr:riboflavin synthase [Planctomycetota bacterium]